MGEHGTYVSACGQPFELADGTTLVLRAVSDPVRQGDYTGFSLLFRGPAEHPVGQGTHVLCHDVLGEQTIFLVPLGPVDDEFEYEAVFSQRLDSSCH